MKGRSGFSLAEVLVAGTLMLLVVGILIDLFVPSMRSFSRTSVRASLQQMAGLALGRLQSDLESSGAGLLTVAPTTFSLIAVKGTQTDGTLVWQTRPIVYHWEPGEGRLRRRIVNPGGLSASNPKPLTPAQLMDALTLPALEERQLAQGVTSLTLEGRQPVRLSLTVSQQGSHQSQPEVYRETHVVYLRN